MLLVYIAGPYRADTPHEIHANIERARRYAASVWRKDGWAALCPHMNTAHMDGVCSPERFLEGTMEMMRRCDAVLMMPGWEHSEGARAEKAEAGRLCIPVLEVRYDLP